MTKCTAARSSWDRFQLTSSRRGWQSKQPTVSVAWTFQLTSSRRGWHFSDIRILCKNTISTHILTKRMTLPLLICLFHLFHFNSHPHEEDDGISQWKFNGINISTHILTKRMTTVSDIAICCDNISTHILTKRMTCTFIPFRLCKFISTHILTKRMTAILNKNNLFKIAYYINNKHFISIVDIFFHFHIYF